MDTTSEWKLLLLKEDLNLPIAVVDEMAATMKVAALEGLLRETIIAVEEDLEPLEAIETTVATTATTHGTPKTTDENDLIAPMIDVVDLTTTIETIETNAADEEMALVVMAAETLEEETKDAMKIDLEEETTEALIEIRVETKIARSQDAEQLCFYADPIVYSRSLCSIIVQMKLLV